MTMPQSADSSRDTACSGVCIEVAARARSAASTVGTENTASPTGA